MTSKARKDGLIADSVRVIGEYLVAISVLKKCQMASFNILMYRKSGG